MSMVFRKGRTLSGEPIAFAIEHGRFIEVATDIDAPAAMDLEGSTVLPGFVDAHCHIMPTGFDLAKLHLGDCETPESVLDAVRDGLESIEPGAWLHAVHYDQNRFSDIRHLHRDQLDAVSKDVPILLRHVNGHASVANTAALRAAGVGDATPDPKGGTYVRDAAGRMTGVLLETAHEHVTDAASSPTTEQKMQAALAASRAMVKHGVTCATDMMTGYSDLLGELEGYRLASEAGALTRYRLYLQWSPVFGARAVDEGARRKIIDAMDPERCKVCGAKIFADGAIGAGTAAIYSEYASGGNGKLIYEPERLTKMVVTAHDAGWPVAVHSIGDRATDHVLDAFESTDDPSRHRLEHAIITSDDQIARIKRAGCHVTMQPEFLLRLGHAYQRQLGPAVAANLKRARSFLDHGVRLSFNSDRPIVPGDPWDGIRTAVDRPQGFSSGENVTLEEAVGLYTRAGAEANGEAGEMGDIAVGRLADFQLYRTGIDISIKPEPDAVYLGGTLVYSKGS